MEKAPVKTRFEIALDQHEISDFFKGNGIYFARGSDHGDHLYINNWQGMCGILKTQKAAKNLLTNIFEEYVKHLKEDYSDAASLLANISAFYVLKKTNPTLSIDNYDLIEALDDNSKKIIGKLFRHLSKQYEKGSDNYGKYSFEDELKRIKNNGCSVELEHL